MGPLVFLRGFGLLTLVVPQREAEQFPNAAQTLLRSVPISRYQILVQESIAVKPTAPNLHIMDGKKESWILWDRNLGRVQERLGPLLDI